jgi:hypothetical protein
MHSSRQATKRVEILLAALWVTGLALRFFAGTSSTVLGEATFALVLWLGTVSLSISGGKKIMQMIGFPRDGSILTSVVALGLGLGTLASGITLLGLVGLLNSGMVVLWAVALSILSASGVLEFPLQVWSKARRALQFSRPSWRMLGLALLAAIFLLSLLLALTPPIDYDGLVYHLQGPRLFLEAGGIHLLPETMQANAPLHIEMLYVVGLAFGNDIFPKLISLTFSVALAGAVFVVARHFYGTTAGWIETFSDLGWAFFELLAIASLMHWYRSKENAWLITGSAFMGWALSSKYLALLLFGILALWIFWKSRNFRQVLIFVGVSLALAAPWYLKNWILAGNPFYPVLFGGPGWPSARLHLLSEYLLGFGTGRDVIDFVLLPINLFLRNTEFGSNVEFPNPLLLLAIAAPMNRMARQSGIAGIALLRFIGWSLSSQQIRFLVPLLPLLAILAAVGAISIYERFKRINALRLSLVGIMGGFLAVTLVYSLISFLQVKPLNVVLGNESEESFLQRNITDYSAIQYVRKELSENARVLMLWDGQGYYCDQRCLPDATLSQWTFLFTNVTGTHEMALQLQSKGITHLLLSLDGLNYAMQFDRENQHEQAATFFLDRFQGMCAREIYRDDHAILFEFECDTQTFLEQPGGHLQ